MIETISFIGSGNVATNLALGFWEAGFSIKQVLSRKLANAEMLAKKVEAQAILDVGVLIPVDLIILAVSDDAISSVITSLKNNKSLIAHTSGATDLSFERERIGFFYPLESFQKDTFTDLKRTPIFVGAKDKRDEQNLLQLAETISDNTKVISIEDKEKLHLAAVFVNNYVNHLFGLSNEFLQENNLDFKDLEPIIQSTIKRAMKQDPFDVQTGPAFRGDESTIEKHIKMLKDYTEMQNVYELMAISIQNKHK